MPTSIPGLLRAVRALAMAALLAAAGTLRAEEVPAETRPPVLDETRPGPRLDVRLFGNIDWLSDHEDDPNTFSVGQLDVFLTSELATNLNVLAEVVLEVPEGGDEQIAEVERFQVRYSPMDALNVSLGRMHTMLGFWNQTYHHGAWLATTAFRPEVYRWEDEGGGFLPVHEVGLRLSGTASVSALRGEYAASLTNGRGPSQEAVVTVQDPNGAKAVRLWLGVKPKAWPGLQLGGTAGFDTIPPDPDRPGRADELRERILGGFLVLQRSGLELLVEGFDVRHENEASGFAWTNAGLYVQAAYSVGRVKPYYRFDWIDREEGDPYFEAFIRDLEKHTVGLRVDPWGRLAVKLEYSRTEVRPGASFGAAAVQVAFTF